MPDVNPLESLTKLLASHLIYALVVIFLFVQQRRNLDDLQKSTKENHDDLSRIYRWSVIASYALIAIAIPIWWWATFHRVETALWGFVTPLMSTEAKLESTDPQVREELTPLSPEARFYVNRELIKDDPRHYTLSWALRTDSGTDAIPFVLSHSFAVKTINPGGPSPEPDQLAGTPFLETGGTKKRFNLNLRGLDAQSAVELYYHPDPADPVRKTGTLELRSRTGTSLIAMEAVDAQSSAVHPPIQLSWFVTTVFAAAEYSVWKKVPAKEAVASLGSPDPKRQLAAQSSLISAGVASLPAIHEALQQPAPSGTDPSLYMRNLADTLTRIEKTGVKVPSGTRLATALSLYKTADYRAAASFFAKVSTEELESDPINVYYRGFCRYYTGDKAGSAADFRRYRELTALKTTTPR